MKNQKASPQKLLWITCLSVVLTLMTFFLGAPLIRVLRKFYGSLAFWIVGVIVSGGFWYIGAPQLAILMLSVWVSLGVQMELEYLGVRWSVSILTSLFLGTSLAIGGTFYLLSLFDLVATEKQIELIQDVLSQLSMSNLKVGLDPVRIIETFPALVATTLIITMGTGIIFERRAFQWFGLSRERLVSQINLIEFKLPDFLVWVSLFAILFSALDVGVPQLRILSLNVGIVMTALYFFQGLAIHEVFLRIINAGVFSRFLSYFIFVGNLFFVLSGIGFLDFWIDIRRRLRAGRSLNHQKKKEI